MEFEEDSELEVELYALLERFQVPDGLRETIMDLIVQWEGERRDAS